MRLYIFVKKVNFCSRRINQVFSRVIAWILPDDVFVLSVGKIIFDLGENFPSMRTNALVRYNFLR